MKLKILPDREINKEIEKAPKLADLGAVEVKEPLKDDDLFESKNIENDEIFSEDIEEKKPIVEQKVEQVVKQKPTKKVKKKRKPLSDAHREALRRGREKALANRRKKAQIRKQLKKERKAEKDKAVEYEYQNFQKQKKIDEIKRKNILLNEQLDLNSVSKFFDLMDKYERLKTTRKEQYYKKKLELKQKKYQQQRTTQPTRQTTVKQTVQQKQTKPNLKYGHLWS